eukprot:1086984-Alexandrium_andersonii.AAC.1
MSASLVGSEMCIRDRRTPAQVSVLDMRCSNGPTQWLASSALDVGHVDACVRAPKCTQVHAHTSTRAHNHTCARTYTHADKSMHMRTRTHF